jgi:sporulation protein YlmC with PRC-barrel domain
MEAAGRVLDAGLKLLDRQLIDSQGMLAGKVDDLELTPSEDDPKVLYVTAILAGPGALAGRLGGHLGHLLERVSNRLRDTAEDRPARVPFGVVKRIDSAVDLWVPKEDLETDRLEQWACQTIIAKLPGAGDAAQ